MRKWCKDVSYKMLITIYFLLRVTTGHVISVFHLVSTNTLPAKPHAHFVIKQNTYWFQTWSGNLLLQSFLAETFHKGTIVQSIASTWKWFVHLTMRRSAYLFPSIIKGWSQLCWNRYKPTKVWQRIDEWIIFIRSSQAIKKTKNLKVLQALWGKNISFFVT